MRFAEFLRTTVMLSAGCAAALAVITLGAADLNHDEVLALFGIGWWLVALLIGLVVGRSERPSTPIARLLAGARTQMSLPELQPTRTFLNRLWPLLVVTVLACVCVIVLPQVPAIAAGFALIWALAWRRQSLAVTAIEQRDGARFYVDRLTPIEPIRLVRTPGFRTHAEELEDIAGPNPTAL